MLTRNQNGHQNAIVYHTMLIFKRLLWNHLCMISVKYKKHYLIWHLASIDVTIICWPKYKMATSRHFIMQCLFIGLWGICYACSLSNIKAFSQSIWSLSMSSKFKMAAKMPLFNHTICFLNRLVKNQLFLIRVNLQSIIEIFYVAKI